MTICPNSKVQSLKSQRPTAPLSRITLPTSRIFSAFTLIEIMVVVGIMAMVMLMSIPFVRNTMHREALTQAMRDLEEVCGNARRKAILQGSMAEIIFHPKERTFQVAGGAATSGNADSSSSGSTPAPPANSGDSGRIADTLIVDMLDVNLSEYKDSDEARVRFYPNGTSDELTVIVHNEKGEYFKMALEATTGLPNWERDPTKFK